MASKKIKTAPKTAPEVKAPKVKAAPSEAKPQLATAKSAKVTKKVNKGGQPKVPARAPKNSAEVKLIDAVKTSDAMIASAVKQADAARRLRGKSIAGLAAKGWRPIEISEAANVSYSRVREIIRRNA